MSLAEMAKPSEDIALRARKTMLLLKVTLLRKLHESAQKEPIRCYEIVDKLNIDTFSGGAGDSHDDGCWKSLAEGGDEVDMQGDPVSEDLLLDSGMEA